MTRAQMIRPPTNVVLGAVAALFAATGAHAQDLELPPFA